MLKITSAANPVAGANPVPVDGVVAEVRRWQHLQLVGVLINSFLEPQFSIILGVGSPGE